MISVQVISSTTYIIYFFILSYPDTNINTKNKSMEYTFFS